LNISWDGHWIAQTLGSMEVWPSPPLHTSMTLPHYLFGPQWTSTHQCTMKDEW
jgi:hypothetical protein